MVLIQVYPSKHLLSNINAYVLSHSISSVHHVPNVYRVVAWLVDPSNHLLMKQH